MGFLEFCGVMFIGLLIVVVCSIALYLAEELFDKFKRRYKYKHRFDKKPIAKCYCVDCIYHNVTNESGDARCAMLHRWTYDDFFCGEATPKEE